MFAGLDLIIVGTPVSQQARRRERVRAWTEKVREAAGERAAVMDLPLAVPVSVTITHYYAEVGLDVDNLAKPILDGLKGILVVDDVQVDELIVRKRRLKPGLVMRDASTDLAAALAAGNEFVHIVIAAMSVSTGQNG